MPETTLSDPRVQDLLSNRDVAVLATIQPDGAPLAMAMWFVHDVDTITMISVDNLQKVKNMRRDPRVCVVVESIDEGVLRCVSIRGRVEFVTAPDRRRRLSEELFDKYTSALEHRWNAREMPANRVMFQIIPRTVFYYG